MIDYDLWPIIWLSFWVSGLALVISAIVGIPAGAWLGLQGFRSRGLVVTLVLTGMGLPSVAVGLVVYLLLSRAGPLGALGWLFTPEAMVLAHVILALPIVAGLTLAAVEGVDPQLRLQLRSLGATDVQISRAILREARNGVIVALIAAFGRIFSEVGAVMLVGANIEGKTRVLTTAIVLETRQGRFEPAIALAVVLIGTVFVLNLAVLQLQRSSA